MSRNLLHKTKLTDFQKYLDQRLIKWQLGTVDYQVMRVTWKGMVYAIYSRDHMPEHYTVDRRIDWLVKEFIEYAKT